MQTNDAHEYTDEQLQAAIDAAFTSGSVGLLSCDPLSNSFEQEKKRRLAIARAFLAALPKPEAAEIAALKAALAESEKQFQDKVDEIAHLLDKRDKAQGILKACLSVMPFGNIETHTAENLPGRISDLASEIASLSLENERLDSELAALRKPVLADDGRSLGQVAAVRPAIEAECLAQAVRRMEAVPVEELRRVYHPRRSISEGLETVRALFIAAAKGEGQTEAKAQPATFEAHGKTWTRHTPGDPMPCDGGRRVFCISNSPDCYDGAMEAKCWSWGVEKVSIIGWRYADEPSQAEAVPAEEKKTTITGPSDKMLPSLDEAAPIGHCAVAAAYVHQKLDHLGVPRKRHGKTFTLWGRVEEYAANKAKPEPAQPWTPKPGDVVRLNSGGPEMTVCCLTPEGATGCAWFDDGGCLDTKAFPAACLTPAKEGQP